MIAHTRWYTKERQNTRGPIAQPWNTPRITRERVRCPGNSGPMLSVVFGAGYTGHVRERVMRSAVEWGRYAGVQRRGDRVRMPAEVQSSRRERDAWRWSC